jgi:hypothetical protein
MLFAMTGAAINVLPYLVAASALAARDESTNAVCASAFSSFADKMTSAIRD